MPEVVEPIHEIADAEETDTETSDAETAFTTMIKYSLDGWTDNSVSACDLCKREIVIGKNLTGLVVDDTLFACEDCCVETTNNKFLSNITIIII